MKILPPLIALVIGLVVGFNTGLNVPRVHWLRIDTHDTNSAVRLVVRGQPGECLAAVPYSASTNGFSVKLVR